MNVDICNRFGGTQSDVKCHGCYYNKKNVCNYNQHYTKRKSLDAVLMEMKNKKYVNVKKKNIGDWIGDLK